MALRESRERERGCGFRKIGGLYLVCPGVASPCGRLPVRTEICAACGQGVKQSRGWTWIEPPRLFGSLEDSYCELFENPPEPPIPGCDECPVGLGMPERAGLIWIGEQFYKTPADWLDEAARVGVSRRIRTLPKGFVAGETIVFVAHPKAIVEDCPDCSGLEFELRSRVNCETCEDSGIVHAPGIFSTFRPTSVEQVVNPKTITEEKVKELEKRGIEAVIVHEVHS